MKTNKQKRINYIKNRLDKKGEVTREEIQNKFPDVSRITLWHDMKSIENVLAVYDGNKVKYIIDIVR